MTTPAAPIPTRPTGRHRKYDRDEFMKLYADKYKGMSYAAAAADLGISEGTYSRYMSDYVYTSPPIPGRPYIFTQEEFNRLYADKCTALSGAAAARALGLSLSAYKRYLRKMREARAVS